MTEFFDKITEYGFDKKEVMQRFLDDEQFYYECFEQVIKDEAFDELGKLIEQNKTKEAFDCVHSLKGILANVGLIALYDKISDIVEILRGTKDGNVEEDYRAFLKLRDECMKLLQ